MYLGKIVELAKGGGSLSRADDAEIHHRDSVGHVLHYRQVAMNR